MRPSLTAMLARYSASGETTMPPWMTMSTFSGDVIVASSSEHCPATVDRQVHARDLARDVAGEEQAGVGDVAVDRDAFQGVVGCVTFGRLCLGDSMLQRHVAADLVA